MLQYLVEHALANVWCNPSQDNQLVFAPKRISKKRGDTIATKILYRSVPLPERSKTYHVFQIGQLDPSMAGLFIKGNGYNADKWFSMSDACNKRNTEVTIYNGSGVCYPRFKSFFMHTKERALVFAIEQDPRIPIDLSNDTMYFRLYTNAYFQTGRGLQNTYQLKTVGLVPDSDSTIMFLQAQVSSMKKLPGVTRCYVNGVLVDDINLVTCKKGDCAEFVYDSSVKAVSKYKLSQMHNFRSELDNCNKLLARNTRGPTFKIDYQDDVDVFITNGRDGNFFRALYLNRNLAKNHRMVTHCDYSLNSDACDYIAQQLSSLMGNGGVDTSEYEVVLQIRDGGYDRSLVHDNERLFELYKLPEGLVTQALTGGHISMPMWTASKLEMSAYAHLMRAYAHEVDMSLVEKAYGYNSIAKVLADTPSKLEVYSGQWSADLAPSLRLDSTVYEYDENGRLLDIVTHHRDPTYNSARSDARLIEVIGAIGTQKTDVVFGHDNLRFDDSYDYRVYCCGFSAGLADNIWVDITVSKGVYFEVQNGVLTSKLDTGETFLMVRTDKTFVQDSIFVRPNRGIFSFNITELVDKGDGLKTYDVCVPGAQIDVWMNGKSCVQGVDYIVEFPTVYITSKRHIAQPVEQDMPQAVTYRVLGFCNDHLQFDCIEDVGWVSHEALSNNKRFDLRDDKVLRIVVGGACMHRNDLKFYENYPGAKAISDLNGQPYEIKDLMLPIGRFTNTSVYDLKKKSLEIDKVVTMYMSDKFKTDTPASVYATSDLYPLVSPFVARLVDDIKTGTLRLNPAMSLTKMEILSICRSYEYLLKCDPVSLKNQQDERFCYICPHFSDNVVDLPLLEYRFIAKVIEVYTENKVKMSHFLRYIQS